ncbi:TetR/AcrR family transcriptional regulator [Ilumatobacter coccineus]|jgi:AcrR family transcriptional regulator|uniref:Putative TetR family transcriptional regulator n=1 Tax=Ilumatobacter coccineus (strain NBRC 103263 / KCTC 29153 / YM16-304) TaxID=1313172 RepID=A0A6C7E5P6_ILUCY|nr:TetR/AcrR family transcriptional regulator [Ilumatobacter coccineus]BAN00619.1 putative TetR family transcriptional regulator [Ilumatobacter coccineus YM16-304]
MTESSTSRIGRPPKLDEHGTPTRERLLDAAVEVCVEFGYDGATLAEIARRADVSTPAVYSHFDGKAELMVAASRRHLQRVHADNSFVRPSVQRAVALWMDPQNSTMRNLSLELHVAAIRHPEVATLLAEWHSANAQIQRAAGLSQTQVKVLYLILLGLGHRDQIGLDVDDADLYDEVERLVAGWVDS